jgi:hypothetical protein
MAYDLDGVTRLQVLSEEMLVELGTTDGRGIVRV